VSSGKPLLLLVEDDDVYRESIHRLAEDAFDIVDTSTTVEARAAIGERLPDCVLLDYRLPDGTGLDLVSELAKQHVPVVMMTAQGSERVAVEAMKAGCQDYLAKSDLTRWVLARVIANAMSRLALERKLAEQRRDLEEFVRTAAHDLRAPLRTITSLCEVLRSQLTREDRTGADEVLALIRSSASQLGLRIEGLLEYTRMGGRDVPHEPVDLGELLGVVVGQLGASVSEASAQIDAQGLPVVRGDRHALARLLQNLLENAFKFRGTETPRVTLRAAREGSHWHVTVADNGIGFAAKDAATIFEPLRRLHADSAYEGSGMGLAICQRIVARHGGRIWAESAPGAGATFHFTLPGETDG
jgi:signal transduction histidine kinase